MSRDLFSSRAPPDENDHVPVGYNSLKCMMNNGAMEDQMANSANSYFATERVTRTNFFDINWGDPVVTLCMDQQYSGVADSKNREGTYAMVTSALNGIEGVITIPTFVKKAHVLLNAFLTNRLTWVGCAAAEKKFNYQNETDHGLFAVAFSGIMSRRVFTHCRVGDTLMLRVPHPDTFGSAGYRTKDGVDPGKITLELCPVRQIDLTMFALRCYDIYRYMSEASECTDDCVSTINTAIFGKGLESFAMSVLVQGVYRLAQFGYIMPNFFEVMASGKDDDDETMKEMVELMGSNPFMGGDRNGSDLFFKIKDGGRFRTAREYGKKIGGLKDKLVDFAFRPEQMAILMAEVFGLCAPKKSQKATPSGYEFKHLLQNEDYERGRSFRRVFLQSIFQHAGAYSTGGLGLESELFKVGGSDAPKLAYENKSMGGRWKKVKTQNGYDLLQNCFSSSFFNLMAGLNAVNGLEKSMIVGMNLRNTQPGATTDFVVCK